jgi:hypothetical protein
MTRDLTAFYDTVRNRPGEGRARRLGLPIFRSNLPDAILIGFSFVALDGVDLGVEVNHVLEGTLQEEHPRGFSIRSLSRDRGDWAASQMHGLDYMHSNPLLFESLPTVTDRRTALDQAVKHPQSILIDGVEKDALMQDISGQMFLELDMIQEQVLITVCGPKSILHAGLTTI